MTPRCPFCEIAEGNDSSRELIASSEGAVAFFDGYPVTEGHTLVIPRRHTENLLELTETEQTEFWSLARSVHRLLEERFAPDGFNIGTNVGEAGGQTIQHAHLHIIPRRFGDTEDPRGGVRWVVPATAAYWDQ